jgi:hypothetical protein
MLTVVQIITIAKISQYLASNDISDGALFGAKPNPNLATQLYLITGSVEQRYIDEDIAGGNTPSDYLVSTAQYLYAFCGAYALVAAALINSSGSLPSTGGNTLYSYPVSGTYRPSVDGETVLDLGLPSNARVVWAQKSIQTLAPTDWSYSYPNLTLLNGIALGESEPLNYLYVLPL